MLQMMGYMKYAVAVLGASSCAACGGNAVEVLPREEVSVFSSSDAGLERAYSWAREMALSYVHDGGDPVGLWYEAALPQREAFCMRDVSHQSVGAHILGLAAHNKNMFGRFVSNISEGRDWCSYWEINRYDKPAPVDYASDDAFWYNLNANFDVMQACLKMYAWTGDMDYIAGDAFAEFYDRTAADYVARWMLEPENVMRRPRHMNSPAEFDPANMFHTCRGLPSYVEDFGGLTMSADLLAVMYAGFAARADMAALRGDAAAETGARRMAEEYRTILNDRWWDAEKTRYQTFLSEDGTFHRGEGVPFILWFGAADGDRVDAAVRDILAREWNVENMSAFPALFYRLGYGEEAYSFLTRLPDVDRCEYPEVSYGVIEGVVSGAMGIEPARDGSLLNTCSRMAGGAEMRIDNMPFRDGYVSVVHDGGYATELENRTGGAIVWRASFMGDCSGVKVGRRNADGVSTWSDPRGNTVTSVTVEVPAGRTVRVEAER